MRPGDVILTKKLRCYSGMKILAAGVPEYVEARADPGHYIAAIILGQVPKGAKVDGVARLRQLGYVQREGYPNPERFNVLEFQETCRESAQGVLDRTPACPHCKDGRPKVVDDMGGAKIECTGCDSTVQLELYAKSPNSIHYAMHAAQATRSATLCMAHCRHRYISA